MAVTLNDEKYSHIKARIDNIRDLALSLVTECMVTGREIKEVIKANPADFKELRDFNTSIEAEFKAMKGLFTVATSKYAECSTSIEESTKGVSAWVKASPVYEAFTEADLGKLHVVSMNEFTSIVGATFYKNEAAAISKDVFDKGGDIEEAYSIVSDHHYQYEQRILTELIAHEGVMHFDGNRYQVVNYQE